MIREHLLGRVDQLLLPLRDLARMHLMLTRQFRDAAMSFDRLHPDEAGNGEYLPLVGDFLSFNEIIKTLNQQGHHFSYKRIPKEVFAGAFPGATEIAEMICYWEAHTYLGSDSSDRIALANRIAGRQPTNFSTWARLNFPVQAA
jgi:hypothetical protein